MTKAKARAAAACAALALLLSACSAPQQQQETQPGRYSKVIQTAKFAAQQSLEAEPAALPPNVKAVIVPHGGEALHMAAAVVHALAEAQPKTVILLGPNHTATGPPIASTYAAFSAYNGMVLPQQAHIRTLQSKGLAGIDDALFIDEHSVGILMPLIARYLPDAKAVPLIFRKGASFNNAMKAVQLVCDLDDPNTVIIASIDFSHGLTAGEEERRRAKMLDCIRVYDWASVLDLDSTYVDAPVVLAALLKHTKQAGCKVQYIAGSNTAELLGHDVPASTGYMTIAFYAGLP